ncbi:EAL domain-containing protein [Vibrio furnissii]|uniref:sensor domain-containing diguanylate cyclase n=2 Tax=Vibrio TaxID=662 RepID=UPI003748361D
MSKINTQSLTVPQEMLSGWQTIVNLLADILQVPAALIMRLHDEEIEVFCANTNVKQPYRSGDTEALGQGLYCETVAKTRQELLIPNALTDMKWRHNPDISHGMVAYCGIPVCWPNGDLFGTICVLDNKANVFTPTYRKLLQSFRVSLESQLTVIYQHQKLKLLNDDLQARIQIRTQDLADLNYSLNQEIDKRKAAEQLVAFQLHHDTSTAFFNHSGLEREVDKALTRGDHDLALLYVGFANARHLQSRLGYQNWEKVLKRYRERVGHFEGIEILTARPTANDLVLLVKAPSLENSLELLCHRLVGIHQAEFQLEQERFHLNAYIGIATHADSAHAGELIHFASEAMLACKDSGYQFHYHSQSSADQLASANALESYLLQALQNDDLALYFQPKVDPRSRRWLGAQTVLRWSHPLLGDVTHEALINMAEQNGLMFEVGNFVLRHTIEMAGRWRHSFPSLRLTAAISTGQLQNGQLAQQIEALLNAHDVPPAQLDLEINENALLSDEVVARNTLSALHQLGVHLTLSEFGSGFASFHHLKHYPFDAIKLDKTFVQQLTHNDEDEEILRSVIHVAQKLHLQVGVEGVDTPEQDTFFIEEGCDIAEGYLYGRPLPTEEFELVMLNQSYSFAKLGGNTHLASK